MARTYRGEPGFFTVPRIHARKEQSAARVRRLLHGVESGSDSLQICEGAEMASPGQRDTLLDKPYAERQRIVVADDAVVDAERGAAEKAAQTGSGTSRASG